MERDSETVGFVTYLLKNLQGWGIPVDEHRIRVSYTIYFLHPFSQGYQGHLFRQSQLGQSLICKCKLALTAVNHYQLRHVLRILRHKTGIASVDDLLHGRIIIRSHDRLDLEMAVVLL